MNTSNQKPLDQRQNELSSSIQEVKIFLDANARQYEFINELTTNKEDLMLLQRSWLHTDEKLRDEEEFEDYLEERQNKLNQILERCGSITVEQIEQLIDSFAQAVEPLPSKIRQEAEYSRDHPETMNIDYKNRLVSRICDLNHIAVIEGLNNPNNTKHLSQVRNNPRWGATSSFSLGLERGLKTTLSEGDATIGGILPPSEALQIVYFARALRNICLLNPKYKDVKIDKLQHFIDQVFYPDFLYEGDLATAFKRTQRKEPKGPAARTFSVSEDNETTYRRMPNGIGNDEYVLNTYDPSGYISKYTPNELAYSEATMNTTQSSIHSIFYFLNNDDREDYNSTLSQMVSQLKLPLVLYHRDDDNKEVMKTIISHQEAKTLSLQEINGLIDERTELIKSKQEHYYISADKIAEIDFFPQISSVAQPPQTQPTPSPHAISQDSRGYNGPPLHQIWKPQSALSMFMQKKKKKRDAKRRRKRRHYNTINFTMEK